MDIQLVKLAHKIGANQNKQIIGCRVDIQLVKLANTIGDNQNKILS